MKRKKWKNFTRKRAATKKIASGIMAAAVAVTSVGWIQPSKPAKAQEHLKESSTVSPDYFWDFEDTVNNTVQNKGTAGKGDAQLKGTAKTELSEVKIGEQIYSKDGNKVLVLSGGTKGSSYAELPAELYKGVTADTGFTYSFWAKTDGAAGSYTRAISSANAAEGDEFAYAPYAADKVWNVIFDGNNVYRSIYTTEPAKDRKSVV